MDGDGTSRGDGRDGDGLSGIKRKRKIHSLSVLKELLVYQGVEDMSRKQTPDIMLYGD